jgi:vancomycin aglycone glucosyltransferase
MVALAVQLQRRGADVRMCAPADQEFVDLMARHRVPHVPFAKPWRSWERPPRPEERRQRVAAFITAQYDMVTEAAADRDVVVATAMSQFVAPSVAEKLGIPYHYALFCPDVVDGLDGRSFNELFKSPLDDHRASIGLPALSEVGEFMFTSRPLLAADPVLGPWRATTGFAVVQTGAWTLRDERPLPTDLLSFVERGTEPVYVGFGSMRTVNDDSVRVAVEASRAQGRRVVIGRGWAGLGAIDGQDDCFVVGEVNHQRLFSRLAAVVHHGGAGTTTTAFRAGTPQVVVPQGGDQTYWARRVGELGLGAAHDARTPTVTSLAAALSTALASETRARAVGMASEARVDGASRAAELLLAGKLAG